MGLFDLFKRNKDTSGIAEADLLSFKRDLTQEVALYMQKAKITDAPILKFFYNDNGLFEANFLSIIDDPGILRIKRMMPQMYLTVIGTHALGTAVHIAKSQIKFHKPVEEFGMAEYKQLVNDFRMTDAYELALNELGIALDSNNKKVIEKEKTTVSKLKANLGKYSSLISLESFKYFFIL